MTEKWNFGGGDSIIDKLDEMLELNIKDAYI